MKSKLPYELATFVGLMCLIVSGAPINDPEWPGLTKPTTLGYQFDQDPSELGTPTTSGVDSVVNTASGEIGNEALPDQIATESIQITLTEIDAVNVQDDKDAGSVVERWTEVNGVVDGFVKFGPPTSDQESESQSTLAENVFQEDDDTSEENVEIVECDSPDCVILPTSEISSLLSPDTDDYKTDKTVTVEALDVMSDWFLDIGRCINWYKAKVKLSSDDDDKIAVSATVLNASDVVANVLQCQSTLDSMRTFVKRITHGTLNLPKSSVEDPDMPSQIPEDTEDAPSSQVNGYPMQVAVLPFASDLSHNDATAPTKTENKEAIIEPVQNNVKNVFAFSPFDDEASGINDNALPNEVELPSEMEDEELGVPPEDESGSFYLIDFKVNGNKYLFNPLYILPILFIALIISLLVGTVYNKCVGQPENKSKFLKVPRMGVFSDVPTLSALTPAMKASLREKNKKKPVAVVV